MPSPGVEDTWSSGAGAEGEAVPVPAPPTTFELQDGETVILWMRPSVWRLLLPVGGVLATAGLMALGLAFAPGGLGLSLKLGVVAVFAGAGCGWFGADWWSHTYVLTDRRMIARVGVVYPMHNETPLSAIRRVALSRSPVERALELGSISTLGSGGVLMVRWSFLAHPTAVQETVLEAVRRYGRGDASAEQLTIEALHEMKERGEADA